MGALAPVPSWIPEDDLLLKNAVEAGASLESLAKGAVRFSRKFTVRELQERWHSLLYDPVVSAEAAFRMIEFERCASSLPSKLSRSGNSKENKCIPGKRKAENVRSCYYALRKRIHNEPFSAINLSFLMTPSNCNYNGSRNEPLSTHSVLGDPVSDHFRLQESDFDIIDHGFQQTEDDGATHAFGEQFQNTVQQRYPLEKDNVHVEDEKIPCMLEENLSHTRNETLVEDFAQQKEFPVDGCSKFDENDIFSSPIPEFGSSFHSLEFPSPLPEMAMWRTDEGISAPCFPMDNDTMNVCPSGYDNIHAESNLNREITSAELKSETTSADGYLVELSNSLLDLSSDELSFMDVDGKELIDKSYYDGLSSLLLSSPNDNQDHIPDITKLESSETLDFLSNQCGASPRELDQDRGSLYSGNVISEVQFLMSESASNPQFPEWKDGVIFCTLNTEDPEIPYNDDIVFTNQLCPKSVSTVWRRNLEDAGKPNLSSVKKLSCNQKSMETPVLMQRLPESFGQSNTSSQMTRSQVIPDIGPPHPVPGHAVKFEVPCSFLTDSSGGKLCSSSTQINSANLETLLPPKVKEEITVTALVKPLSHNSVDSLKCYPQADTSHVREEIDALAGPQNHQDITTSEQVVVNHPSSDPEDLPIESDDDIPYFSDIEAMILDMDLDPEDRDLYSCEEVLKYQHVDTKRKIMRLEQSAYSYMQMAIASHEAFAILYGRLSKHYIKKPEVLLGRATEDVVVDIDLGREGPANKISRRQATICLNENGSFHLRNIGKRSISMNDKEIAPGQSLSLTSGCLIEIRGMAFVFETNQTCVKRYLDGVTQRDHSVTQRDHSQEKPQV